jgi:hypothetical protein
MNTTLIERIEKALDKSNIFYIRKYAETGTVYIEGEHNGVSFKVRLSNHSPVYPCRFTIFIDTFEDNLTPSKIVEEIKKGVKSKYYVGREWAEEVERYNKMWLDDEEEKRNREINKRRYEEYLKLWEDEDLIKRIQALKNRQEIRAFAKANNLKVHNVFCAWKGIKNIRKYLQINISK